MLNMMPDISSLYDIYLKQRAISTDTRQIKPGCIFFALKGDNFDGNAFASKAMESGAAYAVIDDPKHQTSEKHILVPDVLTALQQLALHHREQLQIPFIAITGSNGKTTTKELISSVLSQHYKTYATPGNLNNHIGVPLTLLSVTSDTEVAIIEMGANHQKEIGFLCSIAKPTHGLITNVGRAHLEGFGGFEGVKLAKGELYQYLAEHHGTVFINRDNTELVDISRRYAMQHQVRYGTGSQNLISGKLASALPNLIVEWHREQQEFDDLTHTATSNLTGAYNFENILAAITIGSFFGLSPDEINAGIAAYFPANNRSQIVKTASNTLICDYYNANPSSMLVALDNLQSIDAENKAVILGDMFELGSESETEHRLILEKALGTEAATRLFIGNEFYKLKNESAGFYRTTTEAYLALKELKLENSTVLIKGSRGMKLEQLVELL